MDAAAADARIAEAVGYFLGRGRAFTWWVGPGSLPGDLGARLERFGLRAAEREVGMVAEAGELLVGPPAVEGLDIRRVTSSEELRDFVAVTAANWEPPDENVGAIFRAGDQVLLRRDCPMRLFVGYVDGTPAAGSEVFLSPGVAGIHRVSTLGQFRRRGVGLAMTWAASQEGVRLGAPLVALEASEMGLHVYERLGFRGCCELVEYQ